MRPCRSLNPKYQYGVDPKPMLFHPPLKKKMRQFLVLNKIENKPNEDWGERSGEQQSSLADKSGSDPAGNSSNRELVVGNGPSSSSSSSISGMNSSNSLSDSSEFF